LEAFQAGKAVLATDAGGVREVIHSGEEGILVPPGNARALARALEEFVNHPEKLRKMGEAAKNQVGDFSFEVMIQRYHELYQRMTGETS
jgi:starch synthase